MSSKWTGNSETGILRKSEFKEKKEELFVFGYSCKLFRNDDRALHIDQGKHLIPWMGDETLKIDSSGGADDTVASALGFAISYGDTQRWYDARGALHDLTRFEAPPGGYDWRVELTKSEHEVEQLCDEERYRALHTDEDEELMYKEEELKRLHAAGYGQVGFNYETGEPPPPAPPVEVDEPFVPSPAFKALFLHDVTLPDTQKQNAIIEKTAKFIATQGAQMEILIKAKQRDNPQFKFLNKGDVLHPYYRALIALVKVGKWPEKTPEIVEEKPPEPDEYLHPSLAAPVIESAPSIPSIHYKPSADCDYTMLISKMRGEGEGAAALAPGELPPPGTEPAHYSHAPLMYNTHVPPPSAPVQPTAVYQYPYYQHAAPPPPHMRPLAERPEPGDSTALSLMKNYGSGTDTEPSDSEEDSSNEKASTDPPIPVPPDDVKLFIEKMSTYVARNGDAFADIVRSKNDPRFTFLDPSDLYHPYYNKIMREKRGEVNGGVGNRNKPPVSFSIKKMKEPDPILPKPALPYESSSDEDPEKQTDKQTDNQDNIEEPKPIQQLIPQQSIVNTIPPAVIYKIEGQVTQNLSTVKTIEPIREFVAKPIQEVKESPKPESLTEAIDNKEEIDKNLNKTETSQKKNDKIEPANVKEVSKPPSPLVEKIRDKKTENYENNRKDVEKDSGKGKDDGLNRKEKKRQKDRREYRSKSESREKRPRSRDRDIRDRERRKEKDRDRDKKRKKIVKDDLESEIISLEDNSDEMIDLTGDQSDSKGEGETEVEKAKQLERRRRAAEFLKKVGVDPSAAALPTNSLASAMVETLETIRKKKQAEEEKRRRKEKRRRREKRDYDDDRSHRKSKRRKYKSSDDEESDYDSSKKKKRKKDKKTSKKKKRRSDAVEEEEYEEHQLPASLDLSSTLKELRTNSPTKDLLIPDNTTEENIPPADESSSEDERKEKRNNKRKKEREYSEGEWSSDSEADSHSTVEERSRMEDRRVGEGSPIE